ncbi:uncharacterized protein POS17_2958 [Pseudomonas sp. Os17]|nr:uncharacterized protein POS17_2958 [Pseudomonas sp. Os17]
MNKDLPRLTRIGRGRRVTVQQRAEAELFAIGLTDRQVAAQRRASEVFVHPMPAPAQQRRGLAPRYQWSAIKSGAYLGGVK